MFKKLFQLWVVVGVSMAFILFSGCSKKESDVSVTSQPQKETVDIQKSEQVDEGQLPEEGESEGNETEPSDEEETGDETATEETAGQVSGVESSTTVPAEGTVSAPTAAGAGCEGKININTASQSELETLPRIGPATATGIIDYRKTNGPFKDPHDVTKVKRIGEKTYEAFKDKICAE